MWHPVGAQSREKGSDGCIVYMNCTVFNGGHGGKMWVDGTCLPRGGGGLTYGTGGVAPGVWLCVGMCTCVLGEGVGCVCDPSSTRTHVAPTTDPFHAIRWPK